MGLGIVLLFWLIIGTVLAAIGSVTLGGLATLFTRGVTKRRRLAILTAISFPWICAGWAGALFVFQALVNEGLLHRDLGLGDGWHAPLTNGYQVLMIDVTDQGWVYNPKTQGGSGVGEQEDAVAGVATLQVAGPYILGGVDARPSEHLGTNSNPIDFYFVLDTQTGRKTVLPNYDALRNTANQLGIQSQLEPISVVYSRYRFTWFDVFVGVLFFVPPLIGFFLLTAWIVRLRGTRMLISQST
jgi:hypothetical protein